MTNSYRIAGREFIDEGDVDETVDEVYDSHGNRIDADYIAEAVDDLRALARSGRPSLGKAGEVSPQIAFRVSSELQRAALHRAKAEGKSISQFA